MSTLVLNDVWIASPGWNGVTTDGAPAIVILDYSSATAAQYDPATKLSYTTSAIDVVKHWGLDVGSIAAPVVPKTASP